MIRHTMHDDIPYQFGFSLSDLIATMTSDARMHCADDVVTCATWDNEATR